MTMFVGLKMDEESTETIYRWLQRCGRKGFGLQGPMPKRFIYIPVCYSGSSDLDEDELRSHLAGEINVPIKLENPRLDFLGETGNISLIFQSEWIKDRYKFWVSKDRRFKQRSDGRWPKFKSRIPMSHFCHSLDHGWLKDLPIREIRLVEEFAAPFDRRTFLREVKEELGWL